MPGGQGQPELVDNSLRYVHGDALQWLAGHYDRPLSVATGYVRIPGIQALAKLDGNPQRPTRILIGAVPEPGMGEDAGFEEALQASKLFDEALRRLKQERNFDAFPPSRRLEALQAVDEFLEEDRVEVRHFTERFLHGKAYIFADALDAAAREPGALIVSSANLTAGGLYRNRELGLVHYQPGVVDQGLGWFEERVYYVAEFALVVVAESADSGNAAYVVRKLDTGRSWRSILSRPKSEALRLGAIRIVHRHRGGWREALRRAVKGSGNGPIVQR